MTSFEYVVTKCWTNWDQSMHVRMKFKCMQLKNTKRNWFREEKIPKVCSTTFVFGLGILHSCVCQTLSCSVQIGLELHISLALILSIAFSLTVVNIWMNSFENNQIVHLFVICHSFKEFYVITQKNSIRSVIHTLYFAYTSKANGIYAILPFRTGATINGIQRMNEKRVLYP